MAINIQLFEPPQPTNPAVPAVVVETREGRFLVSSPGGWEAKVPYAGAVRRDSSGSCLRGLAWALSVPGSKDAYG